MREKEAYRDNLVRLDEAFPDRELLTRADVAKFTGLSRNRVGGLFPFDGKTNRIAKATLARAIS